MRAALCNSDAGARDQVLHRAEDEQHLASSGERRDSRPDVERDVAQRLAFDVTFAGVDTGSDLDAERANGPSGAAEKLVPRFLEQIGSLLIVLQQGPRSDAGSARCSAEQWQLLKLR